VSSYVSLFTTLAWIVFIIGLLVIFRKPLVRTVFVLEDRIRGGASFKAGPVEFGQLVTETADVSDQSPEIYGDPDQLQLLFKVQTSEWKKSTKAMQAPNGCLVQVTTERRGANGSWVVAEAVEFVPGVIIVEENGGRTLRATL
jgi:hypothetical protein